KNHGILFHRGDWYAPSVKHPGTWEWKDLLCVQSYLKLKGYDHRKDNHTGMSMVDKAIQFLKDWCAVDHAGIIAGYKAGVHEGDTGSFLVTHGPKLMNRWTSHTQP